MSLAYKLWKIGSILTQEHIRKSVEDSADLNDPSYFCIDFTIENSKIVTITTSAESVERSAFFFSKKMGGAGTGIFYLYPNLKLQQSQLSDKVTLLINTVTKSCTGYASETNKITCTIISDVLKDFDKYIDKSNLELNRESLRASDIAKKEKNIKGFNNWDNRLLALAKALIVQKKGNYIFWLSINGKSFYELMPEIWENWFLSPVTENEEVKVGYDFFTGKNTKVGFRPDIKIFSYDNYHDSLNSRVISNLSLSAESAKNIRFAWMYILDNLVFYYKGLEYIMVPNLLKNDSDTLQTVIKRLTRARGKSSQRRATMRDISNQERGLIRDIEKLIKKKDEESRKELEKMRSVQLQYQKEMNSLDMGWINEVETNVNEIGELKNVITLDFLFTEINRTNLSFSVKGSIEDVVPSRISEVAGLLKGIGIDDNVMLKRRRDGKTLLQDFFSRDQLLFLVTRSTQNNANSILNEQLYLAKLLLTDQTIKLDDLLKRFELNRDYSYDRKKRLTKDGIKEWIEFPDGFVQDETRLLKFFTSLNKIQE